MEFSIGTQFSREFSQEDSNIVKELSAAMNDSFREKDYGSSICKIYIGVICVSQGFEAFFNVRPPKLYRKEPALEFEVKLNFEEFRGVGKDDRFQLLSSEILKTAESVFENKKVKEFKSQMFIDDLKNFFENKY